MMQQTASWSTEHAPERYFLKTARIGFRCWSFEDLPLADALWGDPEVSRFIGGPFSKEQIRRQLEREIDEVSAHGVQYWPIFMLEDDQHFGCAGLRVHDLQNRIYELGFYLRPAYWRRGLAQEAARAVISLGFESLGAEAIFAGHHPANIASKRTLEKLGFRFTHEGVYPPTGLQDICYLLTRSSGCCPGVGGR